MAGLFYAWSALGLTNCSAFTVRQGRIATTTGVVIVDAWLEDGPASSRSNFSTTKIPVAHPFRQVIGHCVRKFVNDKPKREGGDDAIVRGAIHDRDRDRDRDRDLDRVSLATANEKYRLAKLGNKKRTTDTGGRRKQT